MKPLKFDIPPVTPDASAKNRCHPARPEHLKALGLPESRPEDWQEKAVAKFDELLGKSRALRTYLDICVRCGACADKCHFFVGTGDPKNMPYARAELLRKVYRYYFTPAGRILGGLVGAEPLTEAVLDEWYTYFYQCSECRRCSVYCPYGIDQAELTMAAREIMASIGVANKYVTEVIANAYRTGNNIGIPAPAWIDNCQFLEGELKEETGLDIRLPVDVAGAEVLLVPPSADNFVNTDTMLGYAKVFHAAGIGWTTSTYADEAANFGLFLDYRNMKALNHRIIEAARRLNVKLIVFGECGHAWRVAMFMKTLNGPLDFLRTPYPIHICEFTLDLLRRGAFRLNREANLGRTVAYHDPCNIARAGGPVEEPRALLRAAVLDVREMPENTIRQQTVCCGGGGGLLTEELMDLRVAGSKMRAEAFRTTRANTLATICAICKAQLRKVLPKHGIEAEVVGVHDLVGRALIPSTAGEKVPTHW